MPALKDLQSGEIDQAIIGASHLIFTVTETLEFQRYQMLSQEGKCQTFSKDRNGYVRSEGIVCILLQKRKNSRRIYAKIVGGKLNSDGYSPNGIGNPLVEGQYSLIQELYDELNIKPDDIKYFEAHGTGKLLIQ